MPRQRLGRFYVGVQAAAAKTLARIEPEAGLEHIDNLITEVERVGPEFTYLIDIENNLCAIVDISIDAIAEREQRLRALAGFSRHGALPLECCFAVNLARRDPASAANQVRAQIGKLRALADLPPIAIATVRMLGEYTGRLYGPRWEQVTAAATVGRAIIAILPHRPSAAKYLLSELLHAILDINSSIDRAQALADFFKRGEKSTAALLELASSVFSQAVDAAALLASNSHKVHALSQAIKMYGALGDFSSGYAVLGRLPDEEARENAKMDLSIAEQMVKMGELSAFERAFLEFDQSALEFDQSAPFVSWAVLAR